MNTPNRQRRTLAQEFRDSFRAGPRAWYIAIIVFLCFLAFPFFGFLVLIFAAVFLLPAVFGAALGRFLGSIRETRVLRKLQHTPR